MMTKEQLLNQHRELKEALTAALTELTVAQKRERLMKREWMSKAFPSKWQDLLQKQADERAAVIRAHTPAIDDTARQYRKLTGRVS